MPKLLGYKSHHFTGIKANINPLSDHNSVVQCTNLESHVKPGIFTLRQPYTCKYLAPVDSRLENVSPISFDNFYEKTAGDPTEVTVQVQSATVKSNVSGVGYTLPSPAIWIRPYWNGSSWTDAWQWLNETIITKIVSFDSTYINQIVISGSYSNLAQWSIINVTRNTAIPVPILLSSQSTNTTIWVGQWASNWQVGDTIVLMKNYIPIKNLPDMNNVTQQEISFHRIPSKIRIGFGGKENRIALGIEYVNNTLQMSNYASPLLSTSIEGHELSFASANRVIIQPYTQFNNDDFGINIVTQTGSFPVGNYYFRMSAVLDGLNEVLVLETSIQISSVSLFFITPYIRAGSLSRRLTSLNIYFGQDNGTGAIDYYFFKNYLVSKPTGIIDEADWKMGGDGYLYYTQSSSISINLYAETSSARVTTDKSVGSWVPINDGETNIADQNVVEVHGSAGAYFLSVHTYASGTGLLYSAAWIPCSVLTSPIKSNRPYKITISFKGTSQLYLTVGFARKDSAGMSWYLNSDSFPVFTGLLSATFEIQSPDLSSFGAGDSLYFFVDFSLPGNISLNSTDQLYITGLTISEQQTNYLDTDTELGSLDIAQMGYAPTFNLVRDWACALVRRGSTFVTSAFIDQLYPTLIFFSPISGDGNSQYDVLIAGKFLDADKDNFRGESIIAMAQLVNTLLIAITEAGGTIIDPDNGSTQEVSRGLGIVTKESLRSYRGMLFWASPDDLVATDPSGYTAQIIDDDSVRQFLTAVPDNTKLSACIDKYGSYHVALGADSPIKELILTKRGWVDQSRTNYPTVMRNGFMDVVWFMDSSGNIFWIPTITAEVSHVAIDDTGKIATDDTEAGASDDAGSISAF